MNSVPVDVCSVLDLFQMSIGIGYIVILLDFLYKSAECLIFSNAFSINTGYIMNSLEFL